jgi:hypothetical protein
VVAGLLIVRDLRDFYGHHSPSLDLLHREAGAQGRFHLGCQTAEVLLKLAGIAYAHYLEAGVLVQAEEQDSSALPVGEGGKGLEEVSRGACMGGLGFHALELPVAAAEVGDEAFDSFLVHLIVLWMLLPYLVLGKEIRFIPSSCNPACAAMESKKYL